MKHTLHTNQTLLITGASSGIGHHAIKHFHQQGYRVIATCRKPEDVSNLKNLGIECVQMDLADSESIQQAVNTILSMTQRIDLLFNNAAFGLPGAVEDLSREALRHQFETNVFGTQELTNRLLPTFRAQGFGKIIYNSSILGFAAMPYRGAYNASKFAIEGLADTLRLELKDTGIQVVLIEPGPITSNFRANAYAQFQRWIAKDQSAHRENYNAMINRLETKGSTTPFTLGPEAVTAAVEKVLKSTRPALRYRITFPTVLFALLKRLLPARWLDALLIQAGGDGKR